MIRQRINQLYRGIESRLHGKQGAWFVILWLLGLLACIVLASAAKVIPLLMKLGG